MRLEDRALFFGEDSRVWQRMLGDVTGKRRAIFLRPWNLIALGTGLMAIALSAPDIIGDAFGPAYGEKYFLVVLWVLIASVGVVAWGCGRLAMRRSVSFGIVAGLLLMGAGVLGFYGVDTSRHWSGALWFWSVTWIFDGAAMLLVGIGRTQVWRRVFSGQGRGR